jgi:hypothetical protein
LAWSNQLKGRLGFSIRGDLSANQNNRRAAPRRGYNDDAWIRLEDSFGIRHCQLLNLSQTGVCLSIANAHKIPNTFILLLSKDSAERLAHVKWRRGTQIGAEYSRR